MQQVIGTLVVAFVAALLQRLTGFGFALVATPLLAMVMPVSQAVVLISLVALPSGVMNWRSLRSHADLAQVRRIVLWSLPGMPIGLVAHHVLPDRGFRVVLSVAVAIAAIVTASRWTLRPHRAERADRVAGFVSGLLNTSTGTNGPPLVVTLAGQGLAPDAFRATLAGVFVAMGVVTIALFGADRLITIHVLKLTAVGVLPIGPGRYVGLRLAGRISAEHFRHLIVVLLLGTAAVGIVNAVRH